MIMVQRGLAGNSRDLVSTLGREEVEEASKPSHCSVDLQVPGRANSWLLFLLSLVIKDRLGTKLVGLSTV